MSSCVVVPRLWLNFEDVMAEHKERPSTSGVHVTEHQLDKINPSPVAVDETELLIEEFLSPRKLVNVSLMLFHETIIQVLSLYCVLVELW